MRRWQRTLIGIAGILFGGGATASPQERPPDLTLAATGADAQGQPATLACTLQAAAVPSNTFVGHCRITVGGDRLTVGPLPGGDRPHLTVVLNGAVNVRGTAHEGTGRFAPLPQHAAAGFPVDVHVDPFARAWMVTAHGPGGAGQTVASGVLAQGSVVLGMSGDRPD